MSTDLWNLSSSSHCLQPAITQRSSTPSSSSSLTSIGPRSAAAAICQTFTGSGCSSTAPPAYPYSAFMGPHFADDLFLHSHNDPFLWVHANDPAMEFWASFLSSWLGSTIVCSALAWYCSPNAQSLSPNAVADFAAGCSTALHKFFSSRLTN